MVLVNTDQDTFSVVKIGEYAAGVDEKTEQRELKKFPSSDNNDGCRTGV